MKRRALIIEDDPLIACELEDILDGLEFEVFGPSMTEDDAVEAARTHRPDLALVDVRLAKGNGISAAARITANLDLRVVYVTANRDEVNRRDAAAIVVNKPFNREMIERAIRSAFGSRGGDSNPPERSGTDEGSDGSGTGDFPRGGSNDSHQAYAY
jgi:two-component system, response regulator PdtaR